MSPRTYASSVSSSMRNDEPGCIASLSRKKQYEQARLQIAPVGLAMTWKRGGAAGTMSVTRAVSGPEDRRPVAAHAHDLPAVARGGLDDRLCGGVRGRAALVGVLALVVVVVDDERQRRQRPVVAYSSISASPAELPAARIGRTPMCAWMTRGLGSPSLAKPPISAGRRTSTMLPSRRSTSSSTAVPTTSSGGIPYSASLTSGRTPRRRRSRRRRGTSFARRRSSSSSIGR